MEMIGWELLNSVGRFLLHPLTYVLPIVMAILGYFRVKRERRDFHMKVYSALFDLTVPIIPGFLAGLILSIIITVVGIVVPISVVFLMGIITFLFLLTGRVTLLSPAYTVGTAVILAYLLPIWGLDHPLLEQWITPFEGTYLPVVIMLSLMLMAEGILIWKNGKRYTSPFLTESSRGKWVGGQRMQRIWFVPLFMFIPGGVLEVMPYWPVIPFGDSSFSLLLIPAAIGARGDIFHTQPAYACEKMGKCILLIGVAVALSAILTIYYPLTFLYIVAGAFLLRVTVTLLAKREKQYQPPLFTLRAKGLIILGVLPDSPAAKMGLLPGEVIVKVNGASVNNTSQFYNAVQRNSAYSKIEVLDTQGEIRHTQAAVYDNEHHELGLLFVKEKEYAYPAKEG
ncbi:PDZ domain-containing protein [Bacillus piscicola]|uniref:PDZ domain-containing protein n=1 Tax=Bacillus piscicola TaxID=1632684 RepID=UPI001F096025|nr:PDZ domain-containing protein [Bacillus piscicola]